MKDEQFNFDAGWCTSIIWKPIKWDESLPRDVTYAVWKPVPLGGYLVVYSTMAPGLEESIYAEVTA